jgi:hypothetical protein
MAADHGSLVEHYANDRGVPVIESNAEMTRAGVVIAKWDIGALLGDYMRRGCWRCGSAIAVRGPSRDRQAVVAFEVRWSGCRCCPDRRRYTARDK